MNERLPEIEMEVDYAGEVVVGRDGATFIPAVDEDGNLSWSNNGNFPNPAPANIKGKDGASPVVTVENIEGGKRISVTDAEGTKSADIMDGRTPVKGVDYTDGKDGYTPQKNVDYFDGAKGDKGDPGVSCTHSWNGTTLTVTSASGTSSANLKGEKGDKGDPGESIKGDKGDNGEAGYTPQKNVDYFDGADGYTPQKNIDYFDGKDGASITVESVTESEEDGGENIVAFSDGKSVTVRNGRTGGRGERGEAGISAKHSWDGTVLTIESASGVSSADLKGERGLQGEPGKDGTGVTILGSYATEAELIAAHPTGNAGEAYMIDGNLYVWSATENRWVNVGNIKGEDGVSPTVAVSKVGGVTTIEITDKDGAKTAVVNDGAPGKDGYTPVKGVDYFDGADGKDGESIGIEDYGYGLDNTTVAFTDGSVIQIPNGVGIKNIRLSKESETGNTYKIELTNGQSYDFVAPAGPTGKTGADGTSVTVSKVSESTENGGDNIVLFSDGNELTVKNGTRGSDGSNGKSAYEVACDNGFVGDEEDWLETLVGPKGNNGAHGIHAEHWWEGTVLTVRSASGESSADLKGEKGEKGDTPVAGVDFFTEAEKTEMMAPATTLATEAKSIADEAKTIAREASSDADEALDLAGEAHDTATAAMEVVGNLKTETWTFTLEDGSTVTKVVYVG